jgi:hypothetical protein
MKRSIALICPYFNTARMVREYTERYYLPGIEAATRLASSGATG